MGEKKRPATRTWKRHVTVSNRVAIDGRGVCGEEQHSGNTHREEEEINKMQQIGQYFLMIISLDATGQGSQSAD